MGGNVEASLRAISQDLVTITQHAHEVVQARFPKQNRRHPLQRSFLHALLARSHASILGINALALADMPIEGLAMLLVSIDPIARGILEDVVTLLYMSQDFKRRLFKYTRAGWASGAIRAARLEQLWKDEKDPRRIEYLKRARQILDRERRVAMPSPAEIADPKRAARWLNPGKLARELTGDAERVWKEFEPHYGELSECTHLGYMGAAIVSSLCLQEAGEAHTNAVKGFRLQRVPLAYCFYASLLGETFDVCGSARDPLLNKVWLGLLQYRDDFKALAAWRYGVKK